MEIISSEEIEKITVCPFCGRSPIMKIHINSDWVNGPSCILEADGCYCIYRDCNFVYGNGPWLEEKRQWNEKDKTWLNQYGQLVKGTCRKQFRWVYTFMVTVHRLPVPGNHFQIVQLIE